MQGITVVLISFVDTITMIPPAGPCHRGNLPLYESQFVALCVLYVVFSLFGDSRRVTCYPHQLKIGIS